ncbi:MAG: gamma-glutamyltransferase, partial [Acidimicrobiia bacterium]
MPRISVAGPSTFVTDAAAEIASVGGSVVDVAIVASLTAMCSEPGVCAPGGGGFMTIDTPRQPPIVIDGYMAYPGLGFKGTPVQHEVTMEYGGGVTTAVGPATIGVPGSFAALETASEMFGVAPWKELMEVSASALEGGFPLSQASYDYLIHSGRLIFWDDPISRRAIFDGDRLKTVGESVVFEGLAATLRQIGSEGAAVLYRGELGRSLVADLGSRGGTLTTEDLETYRPILRTPLSLEMSGWTFWGNPPPAVG